MSKLDIGEIFQSFSESVLKENSENTVLLQLMFGYFAKSIEKQPTKTKNPQSDSIDDDNEDEDTTNKIKENLFSTTNLLQLLQNFEKNLQDQLKTVSNQFLHLVSK